MSTAGEDDFLDLFGAVKRRLSVIATQAFAHVDLGSTQAKLLRQIGRHARITQAELARASGSDPTLTGRVLQTLIKRGFVRRQRSEEDRREYTLELSAAGRRAEAQVVALRSKLARRMAAALDARDRADFQRIAHKIVAALAPTDDKEAA